MGKLNGRTLLSLLFPKGYYGNIPFPPAPFPAFLAFLSSFRIIEAQPVENMERQDEQC